MDRTLASLNLAVVLALAACDPPSEEVDFRSKSCTKGPCQDDKHIYPGKSWKKGDADHHGLSEDGLDEMDEVAEELNSTCLMVIHDGFVVHEWYAPGFGPKTVHANLFSV